MTLEEARALTGTGSTDPRKLVFGQVDRPDTASWEPATFDLGGGRHLAVPTHPGQDGTVCSARWEPHRLALVVRGLGRLLDARLAALPDGALPTVLVLMDQ